MRNIKKIYSAPQKHWVGDGFHVSPLFSHMGEDKNTSPFLMLDYSLPAQFEPNYGAPRGVGSHPHAGFETVTIALQGEVAHRDSTGGGGVIGTGDVQWMTAGKGIVHQEFHSEAFSKRGGTLEMLQFWVNLPREFKNVPPAYQALLSANIPVVDFDDAKVRLIAGKLDNIKGPAHTYTELNMWEIDIQANGELTLTIPAHHNLMLVALRGNVLVNREQIAQETELVSFELQEGEINLQAQNEAVKLVLLSGTPIDEPIAAYGPFVMNSQAEIAEKIKAFKAGEFGFIS